MHTLNTTPPTELTDTQAEAVAQADAFVTNAGLPSYSHLLRLWLDAPEPEAAPMLAIIRDRHGDELARYELEDAEPMDCDTFAARWADQVGASLSGFAGLIPDGCEDFSVTITDNPEGVRCWASQNYMMEGDE